MHVYSKNVQVGRNIYYQFELVPYVYFLSRCFQIQSLFFVFSNINRHDPSFEFNMRIPQLPRMLCVSLDEIGHMVLKCSCFIFVTQLLSPFNKGFDYSLKKKLESPAFKIFISLFLLFFFLAKFGCSWSCGSRNGNGENTLRWQRQPRRQRRTNGQISIKNRPFESSAQVSQNIFIYLLSTKLYNRGSFCI